jgi:type IV pilus assembly protein PilA
MKKQNGFSLIELLIVVAIILIIAAIAIPNLLRSRIAANEAAAVGALRTLNTAETTYQTTYPDIGYNCTITSLGPGNNTVSSNSAGLIDATLATGMKSGYTFNYPPPNSPYCLQTSSGLTITYAFGADPTTPGQTGQRYFCSDQSGAIKYHQTQSDALCLNNGKSL